MLDVRSTKKTLLLQSCNLGRQREDIQNYKIQWNSVCQTSNTNKKEPYKLKKEKERKTKVPVGCDRLRR